MKHLTIQDIVVPYICPFTLVWHMTSASAAYAELLHRSIGETIGRVALYVDEVIPGNNLRPDHARSFYAIFWLFMEYPDWLSSSAFGWHDLCVIKASGVQQIRGGISKVVTEMLRVFWG